MSVKWSKKCKEVVVQKWTSCKSVVYFNRKIQIYNPVRKYYKCCQMIFKY